MGQICIRVSNHVSKNPEFAHVTMTIRHDGGKNPRSAPVKFNEKNDGGRKAESAHENSASREFRSMTRQEAKAKPGQARNERRGEILRHYIFQIIYRDMLQNKKKYIP